jgi:hypothetical protein
MLKTLAILLATAAVASAQPGGDKVDAKSLMQSGVKMLEAKDYLSALAIFKDAYARFPSAKILLNIGTTLKLLDRKADAANAYQHYLDSHDADPARRGEVNDVLAELDKHVGKLAVTCDPGDAEIQVGDDWEPAAQAKVVRVNAGAYTLHARRDGYQPGDKTGNIVAGAQDTVGFTLVAIPKPKAQQVIVRVHDDVREDFTTRSRFGAFTMAHVSVLPRVGGAFLVGGTADVTPQIVVDAAVLLGPGLVSSQGDYPAAPPSIGAYVGASYAFLTGQWRPRAGFAIPMFESSGKLRFAVRGSAGVEYVASRHFGVVFELGLEDNLNNEMDIHTIALVPALGVTGRL